MVLYYVCTWAIHDVIGSLCNACASETRLITINYDLKVCTSFCSARHACRFDNLASDLHHNILWIRNSTKKSHKVQLNGVKLLNSEQNTNFFFIANFMQVQVFNTKQCYSAVGEKWFSKLTHCNNSYCWWFRCCTCTSIIYIFVDRPVGLNSPLPVI